MQIDKPYIKYTGIKYTAHFPTKQKKKYPHNLHRKTRKTTGKKYNFWNDVGHAGSK
jgi:hypothetical protein